MKFRRRTKRLFAYSAVFFFLMSCTFLFMPAEASVFGMEEMTLSRLIGACFWFFLFLGLWSQHDLSQIRKRTMKSLPVRKSRTKANRPGVFCFFSNGPALLADAAMLTSVLGLAAALLITNGRGYCCYFLLALFSFTFCLHCILNGANFAFIIQAKHSGKETKQNAQTKGASEL